ncbi:MAG: CocE/NonD family hydrolase [Actinomycetota bacterium]
MEESWERTPQMMIGWDVPIEMDDNLVLRADVFRPIDNDACPVILAYGPYAKGLTFQEGYADAWRAMVDSHPDVQAGSSNRYQAWEVCDPEKWVPDGYACVRVDARGWGRSAGYINPWSPREAQDLYECIEWAAAQSWSNGKVGLLGISYYAINQWHVARLQPPSLTAMIPWEGFADFYRDKCYHGGIASDMKNVWYRRTITTVQHGLGERAATNPITGELVAGPETLSEEELEENRSDFTGDIDARLLDDAFHRERSADFDHITAPFLSAGNWGGSSLHLRGNVEAFVRAASRQKWLEIHGLEHWTEFYTDYGVSLQKRFFDHFLKDADNGWADQPRVMLRVRTVDGGFVDRTEDEWPIGRTRWTTLHLDPEAGTLPDAPPAIPTQASFDALESDGVTMSTPPLEEETEITGPVAAKVFVSSSTTDADLFLVLRVFDPEDNEVVLQGAVDPHTPIGHGWLRASHRKLDSDLSRPYRPYHSHDELQPLEPDEIYELDIEIWPTSIIVPRGYRVALTVRGRDYEFDGRGGKVELGHFKGSVMRGVGIYTHADPKHRPADVYGGLTTLHASKDHPAFLLLPLIPTKRDNREPGHF